MAREGELSGLGLWLLDSSLSSADLKSIEDFLRVSANVDHPWSSKYYPFPRLKTATRHVSFSQPSNLSFKSYLMVHNGQRSPAAAASSNSPFGYFTVPFLVPYLQWRWRPWNRWQFGANGPSHLTDWVTAFPANPTVVLNKFVSNQIFFFRESPIKRRIIITLIRIRLARGIWYLLFPSESHGRHILPSPFHSVELAVRAWCIWIFGSLLHMQLHLSPVIPIGSSGRPDKESEKLVEEKSQTAKINVEWYSYSAVSK